jgi:hypothetical protein
MDELPYEAQEFDPKLEDDKYGRMASLIHNGMAVLNQIYEGPGAWPFYGNVLTNEPHPVVGMFIVNSSVVAEYFPTDPVSAKFHAATTRPIMMTPSPEFRSMTGCTREKVSVIVSSDFIPGTTTFMNFYKMMSGKDWCAITPSHLVEPCKTIPVFRYNKAYRLPPEEYKEFLKT